MKAFVYLFLSVISFFCIFISQTFCDEIIANKQLQVKICDLPEYDTTDGIPVFSLDEKYMYFESCRASKHQWRRYNNFENRLDYDLFYREKKEDNSWSVPINMGGIFNNSQDQGNPCFTPNGQYFYFLSLGLKDTVLWISKVKNGIFEPPRTIDGELKEWYLIRNDEIDDMMKKFYKEASQIVRGSILSRFTKEEFKLLGKKSYDTLFEKEYWSVLTKIFEKNNIQSTFWNYKGCDFTIFPDGKNAIFSEDFGKEGNYGSEGKGCRDLYVAEINDSGDWINIKPLPGKINTEKDEYSPFLASDGSTLFFSRADSADRYTIYKIEYENGKWENLTALPSPINLAGTSSSGFKISPSGDLAFFYSDRDGSSKLYEVELPHDDKNIRQKQIVVITGRCIDSLSGSPLKAKVLIDDLDGNKNVAVYETNTSDGKYMASLSRGNRFLLNVTSEGYLPKFKIIKIDKEGKFAIDEVNIEMQKIKSGSRTELANISYDSGEDKLNKESHLQLDKIIDMLNKNPNVSILIEGHTDDVGTDQFNDKLSLKRAESVKNYLLDNKISDNRIKIIGYGKKHPKIAGNDKESRSKNRRVEIVIL